MNALLVLLLSVFTLVQLNCENLFDCTHDPQKADQEFLPDAAKHWTVARYWKKLNRIGQEIIACGGEGSAWALPDVVALCEVENDSVMRDLTRRSLLRTARYEYVMTHSPDRRGINVALLYSPFTFSLLKSYALRIPPMAGRPPTRDILYVKGLTAAVDTLHLFVLHAPSKAGGEVETRRFRIAVARRLCQSVDSIRRIEPHARILVAGDFNDDGKAESLQLMAQSGLTDVSLNACGTHGAKGTYRYQGEWSCLDHVFASSEIADKGVSCTIFDAPFLLEADEKYGDWRPWRTYFGPKYQGGFSDHLPLVVRLGVSSSASSNPLESTK